jgi:hypothetical protein
VGKLLGMGRMQPNKEERGGPSWLDRMFHFLSGASRWSDCAAVSRGVRLLQHTSSGRLAVKRSVRPRLVVERQVPLYALMGADTVIGLQILPPRTSRSATGV